MPDNEGCLDGWILGWDDGCDELGLSFSWDVGQSETEKFNYGCLLGILVYHG